MYTVQKLGSYMLKQPFELYFIEAQKAVSIKGAAIDMLYDNHLGYIVNVPIMYLRTF